MLPQRILSLVTLSNVCITIFGHPIQMIVWSMAYISLI